MKLNWKVLIAGLVIIVPLIAILASGFGNDPRALPSVLEGREAPTFTLTDLDGRTWSPSDLEGRPVVLNFWATWCAPCKVEHPVLLESARTHPEVQFLGIVYGDSETNARRYLASAGSAYPSLVDPDNRTAIDFGVAGVPETFFIDRRGVIVHKHSGALTPGIMREMLQEITR